MSIKNKDGIINDGVYEIAIYDSDLVLDVEHSSMNDGAQIIAFERNGGINQCFRITHIEDGVYTIIAMNSLKAIEANRHHDDGRKVQTNSYSLKDSMKWRFIDAGDDYWQIKNVQYGESLDLEEDWWESGTNICAYDYHGGNNQKFRLIPKEIPQDILNDAFSKENKYAAHQEQQESIEELEDMIKLLTKKKSIHSAEIQATLENLQQQLEELKEQQKRQNKQRFLRNEEQQDKLDEYEKDIMNLMGDILDDNQNNLKAIALCISRSRFNGEHTGIGILVANNLDNFSEDGIVAALEPFTNPRRIKLLKVLIEKTLTASEISQETGLVGGQLYHHLQNLESAGLIERTGDKYAAASGAKGILCSLYTAIGGSKLARE